MRSWVLCGMCCLVLVLFENIIGGVRVWNGLWAGDGDGKDMGGTRHMGQWIERVKVE